MLMVQVMFGARTVGTEQLGVATKSEGSAPATLTDVRLRPSSPVFVSVTSLELLDWPTVMVPKASAAGKIAATGPLTACAGVPEIATVPCSSVPPKGEPG